MKRVLIAAFLGVVMCGVALADPPACISSQQQSCANFTPWSETSFICLHALCSDGGHITQSHQSRFRICYYSDGAQCKEVQSQIVNECGAGC